MAGVELERPRKRRFGIIVALLQNTQGRDVGMDASIVGIELGRLAEACFGA
jgi:hypothetical protein